MTLGQVAVDSKSHEITAIPKLLEMLELSGAIVSIDAMGCQKEIAKQIVDGGGDYVLAVEDNQPKLSEAIRNFFLERHENEDFREYGCRQKYAVDQERVGLHAASLAEAAEAAEVTEDGAVEAAVASADDQPSFTLAAFLQSARQIIGHGQQLKEQASSWNGSIDEIQSDIRQTCEQWRESVAQIDNPQLREEHDGYRACRERLVRRQWADVTESRELLAQAAAATHTLEMVSVSYECGERVASRCDSLAQISGKARQAAQTQLAEVESEMAKLGVHGEQLAQLQ